MHKLSPLLFIGLVLSIPFSLSRWARAQKPQPSSNDMSGMNMSSSNNQSSGHEMPGMGENSEPVMKSMESHHMDMGPHMKMTALRDPKPGDQEKADQIVKAARKAAENYKDYKVALADGFKIFHPEVPQKQYHFTNYKYAFDAAFQFNPDRPTSLLYEKQGDGYKLVGVMYTARKNASEGDLNERIPLSIAQWHAHVNFCRPPNSQKDDVLSSNPKFGLRGSITTAADCSAAGGTFMPQVFGWMVHVYPFEEKPEDIWAVERQGHMD
jgi:hypothetical protein